LQSLNAILLCILNISISWRRVRMADGRLKTEMETKGRDG